MPKDISLFELIEKERARQESTINLIASENYASSEVLMAAGSILTNKYAEGYPRTRYYSGCSIIDTIEQLAIDRCKTLFHAEHANVQPHSGSQANMAAYFAVLKPGDTMLGMNLTEGGHLTHGHAINFSGTFYRRIPYGVDPETEQIDYEKLEQLAHEHKPKLIIAGASVYSRTIDFERFGHIAHSVGALLLADIAHISGLVATGLHPQPFPHADIVTSSTHKTLRGPRGGFIMCKQQFAEKIDRAVMPGIQGGPCMHIIAAKAVAFYEASLPTFTEYQKQVIANAQHLAQKLQSLGYKIVAGGTNNHMLMVDLRSKQITGRAAEQILEKAGITVNRICVPYDPEKPRITSGIRIGTAAITTRNMKEPEIEQISRYIDDAITHGDNEHNLAQIRTEIALFCKQFPLPH